ncbi:MAG: helix-turn-helix transcriptional regulator [Aeriscardovia sp.]|nr:helix-turn-helix transcriptional regulator [Aeriscardovia sp.]
MLDFYVQKRLKILIDNLGISQREFALQTGLTESAVSKYLSGERIPHAGTLINIANGTGVSPNWILGFGSDDVMERM